MKRINTQLSGFINKVFFILSVLAYLLVLVSVNVEALAKDVLTEDAVTFSEKIGSLQQDISSQNSISNIGSGINATNATGIKNNSENIALLENMASIPDIKADTNTNAIENNISTTLNLNDQSVQPEPTKLNQTIQKEQEQQEQEQKKQKQKETHETIAQDPQDTTINHVSDAIDTSNPNNSSNINTIKDGRDEKNEKNIKSLKEAAKSRKSKENKENKKISNSKKKATTKKSAHQKSDTKPSDTDDSDINANQSDLASISKDSDTIQKSIDTPSSLSDLPIKQPIDGISFADNEQIKITLSNRDINRISVIDDKIQSINGPTGFYTAKNDLSGSAYIGINTDNTFTLFASTIKGHQISLLITPRRAPGRTIVLNPTSPSRSSTHVGVIESYQKVMITLISGMISNEMPSDYVYILTKKPKSYDLYRIITVKPIGYYMGSHFLGVISEIRNKTNQSITIKPSNFYAQRQGVRAVALSEETLAPKASGLLYQVYSR